MQAKRNKEKKFINTPQYPGGNLAMKKFIQENLKYPEEALEKQIEGTVYLSYTVTNDGLVEDIKVIKGIGYGCDAESVRIISLLKYEAPHNRGVKVRSTMKTRIRFRLPQAPSPVLNYELKSAEIKQKPAAKATGSTVYGYTITFGDNTQV